MDEYERDLLKAKNRRRKVTHYLRKHKQSLNIRHMEKLLGFRKGRIQKFASDLGKLTDCEITILYGHLKKITRF
ncbi:hypothetical protein [Aquimarina muelleri]|uniref:Uncharacterized protein n=1 Tax=Aquimarina muelleri TaxID=279356 RepID=A0A918JWC8_9FLAO|nr:hypothetical protein [Aquimarina muelleri]MCX2761349.1 hypothetical protein [Aquimarina muelleri]GGX12789.1 hypothetical protein GCM10007384_13240 [Aquimarina muelleri]